VSKTGDEDFGQPFGLKFYVKAALHARSGIGLWPISFQVEGFAPSCGDYTPCRELLKRLGRYFFDLKGGQKNLPVPPQAALLNNSHHSVKGCFAGTGRGTGFSGPN
jgi:hypothetical protein